MIVTRSIGPMIVVAMLIGIMMTSAVEKKIHTVANGRPSVSATAAANLEPTSPQVLAGHKGKWPTGFV